MQTNTLNPLDQNTYRTIDDSGLFMQPKTAAADPLGRDAFMKLLVKQMETQDPLEPMKDQEYISQLATFSSLEQLTNLNKSMTSMIGGQQQLINSQSLTLIGRKVVADTDGIVRLGTGSAETINAQFDTVPAAARVDIFDANGVKVRSITIDNPKVGLNAVQWDGMTGSAENGTLKHAPAGDYTFSVVQSDARGNATTAKGYVTMLVDGIHVSSNGIELVSGDRAVNFSKVIEIRLADTMATTAPGSATLGTVPEALSR